MVIRFFLSFLIVLQFGGPLIADPPACWVDTPVSCDDHAKCVDTSCGYSISSWVDDPSNPGIEMPILSYQCADNTAGKFDETALTRGTCEMSVLVDGFARSENTINHVCYYLRYCLQECAVSTQVVGTEQKRFKNGGGGNPGSVNVYAATCKDGVTSGQEVNFFYFECIGNSIAVCAEQE